MVFLLDFVLFFLIAQVVGTIIRLSCA